MGKNIEIRQLEHSIIRIREIFYREHANLYLLTGGKKNLLIDTGLGVFNIRKLVDKISSVSLMVLNTHCHYDHCGGNKFFNNIHIHQLEKQCILYPNKQNTASFFLKDRDFISKPRGFDANKYKVSPAKKAIPLKHNKIIDLGNFKLRVLHMPGHSRGSICLYEAKKKLLFSGDVIYRGKLLYDLPFSDSKAYLKSLMKLSEIEVEKCFPGHNETLDSIKFNRVLKTAIKMLANRISLH